MRKILVILFALISLGVNAQNTTSNDNLRIYKNAQIGEDGNATINMHNNRVQGVADPISLLDAVNLQYLLANMQFSQPIDSLSLAPLTESDIQTDYTMFADSLSYSGAFKTGLGNYVYKLGQATVLLYYNDNAFTIDPFKVLHLKGGDLVDGQLYPTPELADASDWEKTQGTLSISAHPIAPGEFGFTILYGVIKGGSTLGLAAGEQMWLSDDGTGSLTTTRPEFQSYAISMGGVFNSVTAPNGQIFVNITRDIYDTFNDSFDGAIRESFDFRVTSDGVTITGTLENVVNTNNLTLLFSDGFNTFDTTPAATLTLVAGTATTPQLNYVFIDKATKTLQTSTGGFPVTEHAKIAIVGVLDAVTTQTDGALRNQNTNDHIKKEDDNGHVLHIAERIRQLNAEHNNGTETMLTGTPSNVYFSSTSGSVWQLHLQSFPAQDMSIGDDIHVVNDPVTAYRTTTNLNDIAVFSDGTSWNNKWSNIVVWGVCNKSGEPSHLMVNLPSDGYNSEEDAFNDNRNFTNYNIPRDFKGVGFLMGRFTIRRSGVNFTYNLSTGYLDLRGFVPNNTAGSGGGGPSGITEFTSLTDTPNSYTGFSGQAATVTALEDGLEFTPVVTKINGDSPTLGNYNITSTANKVGEDVTIGTGGTGINAVFSVADNDNSATNEIQDLSNSKLNNDITVAITDGLSTTITNIPRTDFANVYPNTDLNVGLNSDRLDSQEGSYYLDLANSTGTLADGNLSSNVALRSAINIAGNLSNVVYGGDDVSRLINYGIGDASLYNSETQTDINTHLPTGFYSSRETLANSPSGLGSWLNVSRLSSNNAWQLYCRFNDDELWFRRFRGAVWTENELYHSGNSNLSPIPWNAQSYSVGGATVIDASRNYNGGSGTFSGSGSFGGDINMPDAFALRSVGALLIRRTDSNGEIRVGSGNASDYVGLYGNSILKLRTTSSGIDVIGRTTTQNLSVTGLGHTNGQLLSIGAGGVISAVDAPNLGLYALLSGATFTGDITSNNAMIGNWSFLTSYARFGHKDHNTQTSYGYIQAPDGAVSISSASGELTRINANGVNRVSVSDLGTTFSGESLFNDIVRFNNPIITQDDIIMETGSELYGSIIATQATSLLRIDGSGVVHHGAVGSDITGHVFSDDTNIKGNLEVDGVGTSGFDGHLAARATFTSVGNTTLSANALKTVAATSTGASSSGEYALSVGSNTGNKSAIFAGNISASTAPISGDHLTNKTYVDSKLDPRGQLLVAERLFTSAEILAGTTTIDIVSAQANVYYELDRAHVFKEGNWSSQYSGVSSLDINVGTNSNPTGRDLVISVPTQLLTEAISANVWGDVFSLLATSDGGNGNIQVNKPIRLLISGYTGGTGDVRVRVYYRELALP